MKKRNITIDDLARMVKKGFDETAKLMLADHKKRIEKLETEVKELKELLAVV